MPSRTQGWRTWRWQREAVAPPLAAPTPNAQPTSAWSAVQKQVVSWKPWEHVPFSLAMLGVVLYVFQIHSYKLPFGNLPVILALLGVLFQGRLRMDPVLWITLTLVMWAFATTMTAQFPLLSRGIALDFAKVWLISWAVFNTLRDRHHVRFFIFVWLALFALYPVRGAYFNQFICHCATNGRISWNFMFENPNDLAAFTLVPLGMCAGWLVVERHRLWRIFAMTGIGAIVLLVLLTQSRGAFLALAATGFLVLLRAPNRKRNFKVAALALLVALPFAPSGVWERLRGLRNFSTETNMRGVDPEGSAEGRWRTWVIAMTIIRDNPVLGTGPGMYPWSHFFVARKNFEVKSARGLKDAHSTYLLAGAELGLVGLGLFLLAMAVALRRANQARRHVKASDPRAAEQLLFLELGFVGFLIAGIFASFPYLGFTYVYLALLLAFSRALMLQPNAMTAPATPPMQVRSGYSRFGWQAATRAAPRSR